MNANTELKEVVRPLGRVREWVRNPRGGKYEGMDELKESLQEVGLQDAIHVWERSDGDYLLKGHRRFRAMMELGWREARMVVHDFEEEAEAYLYLLQDHGHTVQLNADEKLVAMQNGVALGLTVTELAPALGVSEERAQLWFELGELLPVNGREALASGALTMNVAEQVVRVDEGDRAKAVQQVLRDAITGEPMGGTQARLFLEAKYLKPAQWRREWLGKEPKLRKKYPVAEGFVVVRFEDRLDYLMGESGQPEAEYEYGDGHMERGGELWMTRAQTLGVPVYVVAAPMHAEGMVLVVHRKMMRDAESALMKTGQAAEGMTNDEAPNDEGMTKPEMTKGAAAAVVPGGDDAAEKEALGEWLRVMLRRIYEHLCSNPTVVMTGEPWKWLHDYLAALVTESPAAFAAGAWLGVSSRDEMLEWMARDTKQRAPLRLALMLLLCGECDANKEAKRLTITKVAEGLGVEVLKEGGTGV